MNINNMLSDTKEDSKIKSKLIKIDEQNEMSIYIAELLPNTKLPAHFHQKGHETYLILEGEGKMKIGVTTSNQVEWNKTIEAKKGDTIVVQEKEVHTIWNNSNEKLCILFHTPNAHMSEDRYFIEEEK